MDLVVGAGSCWVVVPIAGFRGSNGLLAHFLSKQGLSSWYEIVKRRPRVAICAAGIRRSTGHRGTNFSATNYQMAVNNLPFKKQ